MGFAVCCCRQLVADTAAKIVAAAKAPVCEPERLFAGICPLEAHAAEKFGKGFLQ
jgi:hypothetical protein